MDVTEVSVLHHIGLALLLLWILSSFGISHPLLYFISFVYLYQVKLTVKSLIFVGFVCFFMFDLVG